MTKGISPLGKLISHHFKDSQRFFRPDLNRTKKAEANIALDGIGVSFLVGPALTFVRSYAAHLVIFAFSVTLDTGDDSLCGSQRPGTPNVLEVSVHCHLTQEKKTLH